MQVFDFGSLIRQEREKQGLSLRTFAKMVELSAAFVSKMETGAWKPPSEEKIRNIASVLGIDPDKLIAMAGRMPKEFLEDALKAIQKDPNKFRQALRKVKQ